MGRAVQSRRLVPGATRFYPVLQLPPWRGLVDPCHVHGGLGIEGGFGGVLCRGALGFAFGPILVSGTMVILVFLGFAGELAYAFVKRYLFRGRSTFR